MTLATVQISVAIVVALIGTWTGLLIAVTLLLPQQAAKAEQALTSSPKRCLLVGLATLVLTLVVFAAAQTPVPLLKAFGLLMPLASGGILIIGGAGLALLTGKRIAEMSGARTSFGALVRGSLVLSLAMGFPYVGWLLFVPISSLLALGAGVTALWPAPRRVTPPPAPEFDVLPTQGVA